MYDERAVAPGANAGCQPADQKRNSRYIAKQGLFRPAVMLQVLIAWNSYDHLHVKQPPPKPVPSFRDTTSKPTSRVPRHTTGNRASASPARASTRLWERNQMRQTRPQRCLRPRQSEPESTRWLFLQYELLLQFPELQTDVREVSLLR